MKKEGLLERMGCVGEGCWGVVEFKQVVFQVPIRKEIANHAIDI